MGRDFHQGSVEVCVGLAVNGIGRSSAGDKFRKGKAAFVKYTCSSISVFSRTSGPVDLFGQ